MPRPIASPWTLARRKLAAFAAVSRRLSRDPTDVSELRERIAATYAEVAATPDIAARIRGLWALERLGCAFASSADRSADETLAALDLPAAARPILHVGLGVAAVESCGFARRAILARVDALACPAHRDFAYESIGAMLGVYERRLPRWLVGLRPLAPPASAAAWIEGFAPATRRLIAHGYGRLLYFHSSSLPAAVASVRRRGSLDVGAALRGVGFAHALVNHVELLRAAAPAVGEPTTDMHLRAGSTYAMVFAEWLFPGTRDAAGPSPAVARARVQLAAARRRGALPAFAATAETSTPSPRRAASADDVGRDDEGE